MKRTFGLSEKPEILLDPNVSLDEMRLMGLELGDHEENIPKHIIKETNEYGWKICEGGARLSGAILTED